jgi:uncharacterized protein involved in exopolysaccharide biosynthesis
MYSLRDLLTPIFRRWHFTVAVFLLALVAGISLVLMMGPQYTSRMAILVSRERQDPLVSAQEDKELVTAPNPISDEEVNSEVELLQSPDVLRKVVLETGLANEKPGFISSLRNVLLGKRTPEERTDKAVKSLAKKLKIEVVIKTNIIDVSYTSGQAKLSHAIVASLEKNFEIKEAEVHRPSGTATFFESQTDNYQKALAQSEADLKNFSDTSTFASPDLEQGSIAAQVTATIGSIESESQSIASDVARIATDRELMSTTPERSATAISNTDADKMVGDVELVLLAAQEKQTEMHAKFAPSYPAVQEADKEVADAKAALQAAESSKFNTQTTDRDPTHELVREDLAKTQADLVAQRARRTATQQSLADLQAKLVELDRETMKRNDLVRDMKANEDNYLLYLSKREQERMSDALNNAQIANVSIAGPPTEPVLPDTGLPVLILATIVGAFGFSLIATYALAYMDSTMYTPDQVLEVLDLPIVIAVRKVV